MTKGGWLRGHPRTTTGPQPAWREKPPAKGRTEEEIAVWRAKGRSYDSMPPLQTPLEEGTHD